MPSRGVREGPRSPKQFWDGIKWCDDIAGVQHYYDPKVDYFLDLRNYAPGNWTLDFRQLMPNDGTDVIILKSLEVAPLSNENNAYNVGITDEEADRLIAYIRGHTIQQTAVGVEVGLPVFHPQLPIKLDRAREINFYCAPQHATAARTAAYGDIRLAHPTRQNYALKERGAVASSAVASTSYCIQNQIAPWSVETTGPNGCEDLVATQTAYTEIMRVDLGTSRVFSKLAAYWGYYGETVDANSGARLGYSNDGTTRGYISTKTNLPQPKTGALWESIGIVGTTARYLHVEGRVGTGGLSTHVLLPIWMAWA